MSTALALPVATLRIASASTKVAPSPISTRRRDNIDRRKGNGAPGVAATPGRSDRGGGARERADGDVGVRRDVGARRLHEVRQLLDVRVLLVEDRRQRGGDRR